MSTVVLGVSSSISIYKACEVLRGFQRGGCRVRVVMTANATRLVSPLLFDSLSGGKTVVGLFDRDVEWSVAHVSLAREAELLCVAPATANIIAKFAAGLADDFLSTFHLAVRCPVLLAPAMNTAMLEHPQTRANVDALRARGVAFVAPEAGYLACGDEGPGRLAEPSRIVEAGLALIRRGGSLSGRVVLVTAGPTREPLDPVRFLSNPSTGKMGYELAREARARGAEVILVSGPTTLPAPPGVAVDRAGSAAEMEAAVRRHFARADVVVMAAAVADFGFARIYPAKVRKGELPASLDIVPTPDILRGLAAEKGGRILVGFAAETTDVLERAAAKLADKRLDLMVANDVSAPDAGFGSDFNRVTLLRPGREPRPSGRLTKREIAGLVWDAVEEIGRERQS